MGGDWVYCTCGIPRMALQIGKRWTAPNGIERRLNHAASAPPASKQPPRPPNEDSDLLNKLRDAMADLLARLKIQPPTTESREASVGRPASHSGRPRRSTERQQTPGSEQTGGAQGSRQPGD